MGALLRPRRKMPRKKRRATRKRLLLGNFPKRKKLNPKAMEKLRKRRRRMEVRRKRRKLANSMARYKFWLDPRFLLFLIVSLFFKTSYYLKCVFVLQLCKKV